VSSSRLTVHIPVVLSKTASFTGHSSRKSAPALQYNKQQQLTMPANYKSSKKQGQVHYIISQAVFNTQVNV